LCVDKDVNCENLVRMLRGQKGKEFQAAADFLNSQKTTRVFFYSSLLYTDDDDVYNVDGNPKSFSLGNAPDGKIFLRGDVPTIDLLLTAVHEATHAQGGDEAAAADAGWRAYLELSPKQRSQAIYNSHYFFRRWGAGFGAPLPAGITETQSSRMRRWVDPPLP
jgi:hypothetical protein